MKKFWILLLAVLTALALCACQDQAVGDVPGDAPPPEETV